MAVTTFETTAKVRQEIAKTIANMRGYRIPFVATEEWLTQTLTEALAGNYVAYVELVGAATHHNQYRKVAAAIKEKYGYED